MTPISFYSDPAFFVAVLVMAVPAIVLGLCEKRIQAYGIIVSFAFIALMFGSDLVGLAYFGVFLAISCAATFLTLRWFKNEDPHAVAKYRVALAAVLLPVVATKVSAVFDTNILGFIGVSYLTFKSVQVLIEIRDGIITEMKPFDYLYFLVFFPVFTSGPIMRSRDMVEQLHAKLSRAEYLDLLSRGILLFTWGALYGFVGGPFFQWLQWFAPEAIGTATTGAFVLGQLARAFFYGFWLFFDFCGYTRMAMGVGSILGIRVPDNFHAPFRSLDIMDYWNRWHITLSHWMRDFVFMRLTMIFLKHKTFSSRLTSACCALMLNMMVMALWHGITPGYFFYGLFQGMMLVLCEIRHKKSKLYKKYRKETWYKVGSWALTMLGVWVAFSMFSGQIPELVMGVING